MGRTISGLDEFVANLQNMGAKAQKQRNALIAGAEIALGAYRKNIYQAVYSGPGSEHYERTGALADAAEIVMSKKDENTVYVDIPKKKKHPTRRWFGGKMFSMYPILIWLNYGTRHISARHFFERTAEECKAQVIETIAGAVASDLGVR